MLQRHVHCVSKNVPPLTCYNLDVHDPSVIIFGRSVKPLTHEPSRRPAVVAVTTGVVFLAAVTTDVTTTTGVFLAAVVTAVTTVAKKQRPS